MSCLHFDVKQVVSNSQLFVFYSENTYMTIYGYITNWNESGYFEAYDFPGK